MAHGRGEGYLSRTHLHASMQGDVSLDEILAFTTDEIGAGLAENTDSAFLFL